MIILSTNKLGLSYNQIKRTCYHKTTVNVKHYKRVFVITAAWDFNFHHFLIDEFSRLSLSYDFLMKPENRDIKIHIRRAEDSVIMNNKK